MQNVTMMAVIVVEPMSIQPTVRNVNALTQILQLLQLYRQQLLIPPAMMILLGAAIVHIGPLLDFALIKTMRLSCNPFAKRVVDFVNLYMRCSLISKFRLMYFLHSFLLLYEFNAIFMNKII